MFERIKEFIQEVKMDLFIQRSVNKTLKDFSSHTNQTVKESFEKWELPGEK